MFLDALDSFLNLTTNAMNVQLKVKKLYTCSPFNVTLIKQQF